MLRSVFSKWLWDSRRSILGWILAIVGVGCGYAAFWPTINTPGIQEALESYPEALLEALNYDDVSTPAGYLTATVYGLIVAVLLIVYTVSAGTRTIAGDEEAGYLELVAAHPVARGRLALQRFAALMASVTIIAAAFLLAMLAITIPAQLEGISIGQYAAMHLQLILFAGFFGALSFAVGAATGRRALAIGTGSAAGVLGYAAYGLLPQVDGLGWVENLSPFHWLSGGAPLRNGFQVGEGLLMVALAALLVAWGAWAFTRRDIAV